MGTLQAWLSGTFPPNLAITGYATEPITAVEPVSMIQESANVLAIIDFLNSFVPAKAALCRW